jgi:NAD(P)-dependent dehydrogenase (short-subunit alcohol dehydrogenase family)
MEIEAAGAVVSGGASGLGAATVRHLHGAGAHVVIADLNAEAGAALAAELGDRADYVETDVSDESTVQAAVDLALRPERGLRIAVACAGIGWAQRVTGKAGPHSQEIFNNVLQVNLVGTFNLLRLAATSMNENEPDQEGERGVFIGTASAAAFDGQIGQVAYSASKGGVVGMVLPAARDLSSRGIRVVAIAPGLFDTPMMAAMEEEAREALGARVPFPNRLGRPEEYAQLVAAIVENPMMNGETIRVGELHVAARDGDERAAARLTGGASVARCDLGVDQRDEVLIAVVEEVGEAAAKALFGQGDVAGDLVIRRL